MSVDNSITIDGGVEEETPAATRTYALDFENGCIVGMVDGQEAVRQYIHKALITPRFRCLIYDHNYGSEIRDTIIEQSASRDYIVTEMPFLIKDALQDERIIQIYNVEVTFPDGEILKDCIKIEFDVDTIYGTISAVEEVI